MGAPEWSSSDPGVATIDSKDGVVSAKEIGTATMTASIGAFQAIQHKLVEMQNSLDGARLATYYAAWLIDRGQLADYFVSLAKAQASDAARIVCFEGHEIHAGIGFMREYDLQLYYRRAKVAELEFGDARAHRLILAQGLRESSAMGRI